MGSSHLHEDGGTGSGEAKVSEAKPSEAQSPPVEAAAQQQAPPGPHPPKKHAKAAAHDDDTPPAGELLSVEFARLRARSAVDPSVAGRSLAPAWTGPTAGVEDDEAEFIDAMADCLGAGLSLDTALACWHTGDLAYDPQGSVDDADESGPVDASATIAPHHPGTGRRLLVR